MFRAQSLEVVISALRELWHWIPALAGMTVESRRSMTRYPKRQEFLIPAHAGISRVCAAVFSFMPALREFWHWIPALAGMTVESRRSMTRYPKRQEFLIPADAGISRVCAAVFSFIPALREFWHWIPALAGMTVVSRRSMTRYPKRQEFLIPADAGISPTRPTEAFDQ